MSELDNAQDGALVAPATQDSITEPQAIKPESTPAENAKEEAEKESGVQKRINELTKSWRTEERQKQAIAAENAELKRQLQERLAAPTKTPTAYPKLKDYDYDEDAHAEAVERYYEDKSNKSIETFLSKQDQNKAEETARQEREKLFETHEKRAAEYAKTTPDFHDAMESLVSVVRFLPEVAQVIGASEKSPEILYYLANNLDEADKIAHMSPTLAAAQIGRIESRLSVQDKKTISTAPPPTTQIKSGSVVSTDPAKLSDADWFRQRQSKSN